MADTSNRVVIDSLDWKSVLPVLRLASAFKHALQPGKLLVALIAVLAIHLSGSVLDVIWSAADQPMVYAEVIDVYAGGAGALMHAALAWDFTFDSADSVPNSLGRMVLWVPMLLFQEHPWFMLLFGADVLFVLAMASGILTRMSASQVCANRPTPLSQAVGSVAERWGWYLLTPLMPAVLIAVAGALLALAGLIFFNVPGLDVVGSLGFGLLLVLGFVVGIVTLLLLFAMFLMPPALSVEGSDGFDAIARSFNYILFRPWQFAVYLFASLLYLAAVYLVVGTVAAMTVSASAYFVELGAIAGDGSSRFEQISRGDSGGTIGVGAWLMARWMELVAAVVVAILFSTFCCLQTQVYVLMRRSADGTPMDEFAGDSPAVLWSQEQVASESAARQDDALDPEAPRAEG